MVSVQQVLLAVLIFQSSVKAAPSEPIKLEDIAKVETAVKLDDEPNTLSKITENDNNTTEQGQRQKRFYNYYGYGFPPMNPVIYPNYVNRDGQPNGGYGYEDPFAQIYKRLQDIVTVIRQPNIPPPPPFSPSHYPIFFPVIYIPQFDCACNPNQYIPPNNQNPPTQPPQDNNNINDTDVGISNRFPEMEDERQNWGFVINETEVDDGQEEDFTRPISFEPIRPNRTMSRPPPAVDHGSSQAGQSQGMTTTTTTRPSMGNLPTTTIAPPLAAAPPSSSVEAPSACDGAILSCCHQPQVTYDCFAVQGCPDPTPYGNPCEIQVILRVIDRYQRFYGQRTG